MALRTSKTAFKMKYIIDIYSLARDGASDKVIAKHLGVTPACFCGWKRTKKAVTYALKRADSDRKSVTSVNWKDYIRQRIPSHLKDLWDEITRYESDISGYDKVKLLLGKKSRRIRQELLVFAILSTNFNVTKALKKVGIPRGTFNKWSELDPDFVTLLNEVTQIKKDFFEEGLIKLVQQGDSPATIFGNRTLNSDRGYGEKIENRLSASVTVTSIPISELDLPSDILRIILNAVKARDTINAIPVTSITKDAVTSNKLLQGDTDV
jgi:hypothetical protein